MTRRTPPRLRGAAAENHAASAERREAEQRQAYEAAEDVRAVGRMMCALAARIMGVPAADALAALGSLAGADGRADALRVLRMAGLPPEAQASAWRGEAPAQRRDSAPWAGSPDHDPRVLAAITSGAPDFEVARIRAAVAAEYRDHASRRQPSPEMWRTASGEVVTDGSAVKAPRQVSKPYPGPQEV